LFLLGESIAFFLSQQNLNDDSLKVSMIRLEQPVMAIKIDSVFQRDLKGAEYLSNKREEEVKLMLEMIERRKDLKTIESQ